MIRAAGPSFGSPARAAVERLGPRVLALGVVEPREVVRARGHGEMVRTAHPPRGRRSPRARSALTAPAAAKVPSPSAFGRGWGPDLWGLGVGQNLHCGTTRNPARFKGAGWAHGAVKSK
jgi:hypothetical protein